MPDLTPDQAIAAARELRADFNEHKDLLSWRAMRLREPWKEPRIKALNIVPTLKDIVPYQSDMANQEAHRYANAFATAEPEFAVFTRSEKKTEQDIGARLELVYDGAHDLLWPDPYPSAYNVSGEGMAVVRLDLKPAFWRGMPDRTEDEEADAYNDRADGHRRAIGLPFELVTLDPSTVFYEEDKGRRVTVVAEYGERKASVIREIYEEQGKGRGEELLGPTVPEGQGFGQRMATFVVLRTMSQVFHILLADKGKGRTRQNADKILWEGRNVFHDSTGYVLWRGLYSGDPNPDRRYHPLIMGILPPLQHYNLFLSLQANLAVQEQAFWEETQGNLAERSLGRAITAEAKGQAGGRKSGTRAVATLEEGKRVMWREMRQEIDKVLGRMEFEIERYRFPEPLAPEVSTGSSGRDTIRRQEVAAKLLHQGFEGRRTAVKELVTTVVATIFNHKPFLASGRFVYVPTLREGLGDEGTERKQEMLYVEEGDNIPHELQVEVATMSQAAQAALREEGLRMVGHLSSDTLMQDFYGVKNIPLERRRLAKDTVRQALYAVAMKKGLEAGVAALEKRVPAGSAIVVGDGTQPQPTDGQGPPITQPAASGRATPPELEDIGLTLGAGGGLGPAPEG